MSATDELRRMLDERGIGWDYGANGAASTECGAAGSELTFTELSGGLICSTYLSPARAMEIIVGHGKCRNVAPDYLDFLCSACGFVHYHSDENDDGDGNGWFYCPNCGRKVVG